jgi:VIT1/CCC1 family predicted Fe2+/Mn2+ transporter
MPSPSRYRRRLAREQDAAAVYRALASGRTGDERESLLALARAEERHARHWVALLGEEDDETPPPGPRQRLIGWLARRMSSLLVLAMVQRAELDGSYDADAEATAQMAADERVHARVVEVIARRRRARASGIFRAGVFGINDGLVSNVSLVLGIAGAGEPRDIVLLAGLAGLLAGALSMAAGEYVSVRSQRELLGGVGADAADPAFLRALDSGDPQRVAALLRGTGMPSEEAEPFAEALVREREEAGDDADDPPDVVGSPAGAALSSFAAFATGAFVPVLPYLVTGGAVALWWAVGLTGIGLFAAGTAAGVLTGGPLLRGGLRQLTIGGAAAAATYLLGRVFGVSVS